MKRTPTANCATAEDRYIHSDIFVRLVRDKDDIPGLVAYGIYQIRKREWIDKHQREYGCLPSREDVKKYSFGWGDGALEALRQEAEGDMYRFAESVVEARLDELMSTAFNTKTTDTSSDLWCSSSSLRWCYLR